MNSKKCKVMSFNTQQFMHFDVTFGVNELLVTSTSSSSTPNSKDSPITFGTRFGFQKRQVIPARGDMAVTIVLSRSARRSSCNVNVATIDSGVVDTVRLWCVRCWYRLSWTGVH